MAAAFEQVTSESEATKKRGDVLFARGDYLGAIAEYSTSISQLNVLRGCSIGENLVLRIFSNMAACHIKLEDFEKAVKEFQPKIRE